MANYTAQLMEYYRKGGSIEVIAALIKEPPKNKEEVLNMLIKAKEEK